MTSMRLMLDLMRSLSMQVLRKERFGAHGGDVLLICAVTIGHIEHKPMAAHKLAQYAGLTRPTAVRRLERLEAMGLVRRGDGGTYTLTTKGLRCIEVVR
ncbi:MarR family transcriptional regulator [Variovorax sp. 350MFTsu5.1]|uniref:MarR family transcriptional regulator n=1 Tax=Variovorax sp. 350MFTsu5.1 TaxID=3158365 RepID=UPI003AAB4A51